MSDVIVSTTTNNDMLLNTYEKCLMCLFSLLLLFPFCRWQADTSETDEVRVSHAVTNFEVNLHKFAASLLDYSRDSPTLSLPPPKVPLRALLCSTRSQSTARRALYWLWIYAQHSSVRDVCRRLSISSAHSNFHDSLGATE